MSRTRAMTDRHSALRHHLGPNADTISATPAWTLARIDALLHAAGINPDSVSCHISAETYRAATGQPIADNQYGMATRNPHHIYVRPHGTRSDVERIVAHEVTHLTHWTLGHRATFFEHAQTLLNRSHTPCEHQTAQSVPPGASAAPRASPDT